MRFSHYLDHLKKRSLLALVYRRYWLYPKLSAFFTGTILDIGCGIGDFISHRPQTVGVDINPHIVRHCRANGLDVHHMEKNRLPFPDLGFDGAILDNVLEHLREPDPLLRETHRILKSQGKLIIGVPGERGFEMDPDHKRFYSEQDLVTLITAHGFTLQRVIPMPIALPWLASRLSQYCIYGVFTKND